MLLKKCKYFFFLLLLYSCNDNIDRIFRNKKVEDTFIVFCKEIQQSDLKKGNNVFVYSDSTCNSDNCGITIINSLSLNDDKGNYGKFRYKHLNVYVDKNISNKIISLKNYNSKVPNKKNDYNGPIEFIEMWVSIKSDTVRYRAVNFKNLNSNEWIEVK